MATARKFSDDETVYAKWPGSGLYYKAKIISYAGSGKYDLKFDSDDTNTIIPTKDIKKESYMASRSKSPGRRSRSSSPSRRRRSRSPSRKAAASHTNKSPEQKSTSPRTKLTRSPVTRMPRSPARVTKKPSEKKEEEKVSPRVELERVPSERSAVVQKAKQIMEELQNSDVEELKGSAEFQVSSVTKSTRSASDERSTVTRRTTRSVTRALNVKQEGSSESQQETPVAKCCNVKNAFRCTVFCVGSFFLNSMVMVVPIFLIYGLYLSCRTLKGCTLLKFPAIPACEKFFNWKSTAYVFGWFLFQLALSSLPIGKRIDGPELPTGKKETHILNGFASLVISLSAVLVLNYFGKFPVKYITVNYLSLITAAVIFALLISIATLFISRKASSKEPSGGILKDFVAGRIVSPVVCPNINLKTFAFKTGFISWTLMDFVYCIDAIQEDWRKNICLIFLVGMQAAYVVDKLLLEEAQLYTTSLKEQKIGYMFMFTSLVLFPFFLSIQSRYLHMRALSPPWYYYIAASVTAIFGFIIHHQSTIQKFMFRKDPEKAIAEGATYIPTIDGKGVLCDGWWAQLRKPNYFGEIIQATAWALLCGFSHFVPWLNLCIRLPMMMAISNEDDINCQKKYGHSWVDYQKRVKRKMLPFVF